MKYFKRSSHHVGAVQAFSPQLAPTFKVRGRRTFRFPGFSRERRTSSAFSASRYGRVQTIVYGVLPQIAATMTSFVIYIFEINVRASVVLGFVGAGGVGLPLIQRIQFRRWDEVLMMVIVAVIIVIDMGSSYLRRRLV